MKIIKIFTKIKGYLKKHLMFIKNFNTCYIIYK